jgi:glyceraldehyde-3-phosphate dehydrogenase/erythrose-4-phosphate dehydrogenase
VAEKVTEATNSALLMLSKNAPLVVVGCSCHDLAQNMYGTREDKFGQKLKIYWVYSCTFCCLFKALWVLFAVHA